MKPPRNNPACSPPDAHPADNRSRVVLVDDHPLLRDGMKAVIAEQPDLVVCGEAEGVFSAIEEIGRAQPDIVIVDLSIKDGDGLELIRQIRQRWPDVKTLVLSLYDETIYAERAIRAGALGYIMKAHAARSLIEGIRCVLSGQTYLSEAMQSKLRVARDVNDRPSGAASLSDRELQVLRYIGQGRSGREIGEVLFISPKTVEAHRENMKHKLGLATSSELLRFAIEHNRLQG